MKYTHVIWDIDNTMLDTEEELMCSLIQALREKYGVERNREELWFAMVMPAKETVRHLGIPEEDQEEVRQRWNQLTRRGGGADPAAGRRGGSGRCHRQNPGGLPAGYGAPGLGEVF